MQQNAFEKKKATVRGMLIEQNSDGPLAVGYMHSYNWLFSSQNNNL